jgi:hypothetical protein
MRPGLSEAERLRTARALAVKEATDRYRHELMDHEERLLVLERIKRLRKSRLVRAIFWGVLLAGAPVSSRLMSRC